MPLGLFGATDPESLAALVPGPVKKDTNNWAPRVGFAWSPRSNNCAARRRPDGHPRRLRHRLRRALLQPADRQRLELPARRHGRISTTRAWASIRTCSTGERRRPVFNPLARLHQLAGGHGEPGEPLLQPVVAARVRSTYLFEVGYSGSRGYKGINQIHANPAILTPEQAALVAARRTRRDSSRRRRGASIPQFGVRTLIPAYVGPGRQRRRGALRVQRRVLLGEAPLQPTACSSTRRYTYSQWIQQQRRVARRRRHGQLEPAAAEHVRLRGRSGAGRSSTGRTGSRRATSGKSRDRTPASRAAARRLAVLRHHAVQSGQPFTIFTGVDSNGDGNTGSGPPERQPVRHVRVGRRAPEVHEQRLLRRAARDQRPAAGNSLGNGNGQEERRAVGSTSGTRPEPAEDASRRAPRDWSFRVDAFNLFNQDDYGVPQQQHEQRRASGSTATTGDDAH